MEHKRAVAVMREKWIEKLSERICELLNSLSMLPLFSMDATKDFGTVRTKIERLNLLNYEIRLLLNRNETDQKALDTKIFELIHSFSEAAAKSKGLPDSQDVANRVVEIMRLSETILQRERDRISQFD